MNEYGMAEYSSLFFFELYKLCDTTSALYLPSFRHGSGLKKKKKKRYGYILGSNIKKGKKPHFNRI